MSDIVVNINGKEYQAKEGEYILNIARANGVFIPALCYLTNCSPTLACRLCLVEINGKRVYSCNAKAKDGMQVITQNEEIQKERNAIMKVYDINHPLECGVCDQSGECALQNYTLEMNVNSQEYSIKDVHRPTRDWGRVHYDPALCIVCERCVTVCRDMIGESALKNIPRGGDAIDADFKANMPKDVYAMWNKLQKSIIGIASGAEVLDCTLCGECTAVCPVGALVGSDFQYKSNAWELKKIPASNPHSSDCSLIYYDVKHTSTADAKEKIYRVSSDFNYAPIHAAARYGYDFDNTVTHKDTQAFAKVIEALQTKVDTIKFTSYITNEEALILQKLKEKFGYKLVNKDAFVFANFMKNFAQTSGTTLYNGDLVALRAANFVISLGAFLKNDSPNSGYAFNNALRMNKGAGIYFHPISDNVVNNYSKKLISITHQVGAEEAILYLLLDLFGKKLPLHVSDYLKTFHTTTTKTITENVKETIMEMVKKTIKDEESGEEKEVEVQESKVVTKNVEKQVEVDSNKLFELIGMPEDFMETLQKLLEKKDTFALVVGEDLYAHPRATNLAKLLGLVQKYTDFSVTLIPSKTNTLGVSLICDLDAEAGKFVLGYNEKADITLSALGGGDLDMPALNQQEGTFASLGKKVVPTNVAVSFGGYCLNDIANALGLEAEYTIDYTQELPTDKGFKAVRFDDLPNEFDNSGNENRGYLLDAKEVICDDMAEEIKALSLDDTQILYLANPVHQFSPFTNKAHQLNEAGSLFVSSEFLEAKELQSGDMVKIDSEDGSLVVSVKVDTTIGGNIVYLPTFDTKLNAEQFFSNGYRFAHVSIGRV
ncbi:MAG: NADH-quinone oxidoreductase subunit G [Sulfurospirillum sp.]|nr:NADH-quinone oxidoreductase subunit G [Sulfurospirillum sp.]